MDSVSAPAPPAACWRKLRRYKKSSTAHTQSVIHSVPKLSGTGVGAAVHFLSQGECTPMTDLSGTSGEDAVGVQVEGCDKRMGGYS